MVNSSNGALTRRWPLRLALGGVLCALMIVGFRFDGPAHSATATPTTSALTGTTTTGHSATSTTPAAVPIATRTAVAGPGRGCRLDARSTATPRPTTSTSTTTGPGASTSTSGPGSTSSTSTTTLGRARRTLPPGRCVVLEIGDSVGKDLGWGLSRQLSTNPGLHLVLWGRSSTGLTNSWFYDWPVHLAKFMSQYHPHVLVVAFGANDEQRMAIGHHGTAFNSPQWRAAYSAQIRRIARIGTRYHCYVLWVGMPIMGPPGYRQGMEVLNSLYEHVATRVSGVTFLSTWSLLAGPRGQFRASALVNHVPAVLRQPDGIHFTNVGENVLATFVAHELGTIYHVVVHPAVPAFITG